MQQTEAEHREQRLEQTVEDLGQNVLNCSSYRSIAVRGVGDSNLAAAWVAVTLQQTTGLGGSLEQAKKIVNGNLSQAEVEDGVTTLRRKVEPQGVQLPIAAAEGEDSSELSLLYNRCSDMPPPVVLWRTNGNYNILITEALERGIRAAGQQRVSTARYWVARLFLRLLSYDQRWVKILCSIVAVPRAAVLPFASVAFGYAGAAVKLIFHFQNYGNFLFKCFISGGAEPTQGSLVHAG